jgi:hypothetical protein
MFPNDSKGREAVNDPNAKPAVLPYKALTGDSKIKVLQQLLASMVFFDYVAVEME